MIAPEQPELHILHITAPAQFGGLERVVEMLCSGLGDRGVRNTVVAVLDREQTDHPFVEAIGRTGATVIPLVIGARAYAREARTLARIARELQPDLVHTHGPRSDVIGGNVARRAALPRVSTLHGFMGRSAKGRLFEWLELRILRRFDAVIGVSASLVDRARVAGVPAERTHLIPNAWDGRIPFADRAAARRELGLPDDAFVTGWIGRLSHEKGADVFLQALAQWQRTGGASGAIASIIGDGGERAALTAQAEALGIAGMVRWHGMQRIAGRLMRAFDAFVLSSRTEGVPMALLEAMHAGIPVVATAVGGVPSVVDGTQALLVPSESPDDLAAALAQVRADPAAAGTRVQRAGERLASQFHLEGWVDRYLAVYRGALPTPMGRG